MNIRVQLLEYIDAYWSLHNYSAFQFIVNSSFVCLLVGLFAFLFKLETLSSSYPQNQTWSSVSFYWRYWSRIDVSSGSWSFAKSLCIFFKSSWYLLKATVTTHIKKRRYIFTKLKLSGLKAAFLFSFLLTVSLDKTFLSVPFKELFLFFLQIFHTLINKVLSKHLKELGKHLRICLALSPLLVYAFMYWKLYIHGSLP